MRLTTIALLAFFILSCAGKNSKNNTFISSQDSLMNGSIKHTVSTKDSILVKERFYDRLSLSNNFKLSFYAHAGNLAATKHYWTILIYDKKMNLLDSIVQPIYVFDSDLVNLEESRSYTTGINQNSDISNNDYGNFVVADFNFDLKDDFAIINDLGGNGGTFYSYYIQQRDNKFVLDKFLTDSMTYFPTKIMKKNRTLITTVPAGACWLGEHKYKLDSANKWAEFSKRKINGCKAK